MPINPQNPLVVQSDRSILLEVDNPQYGDARDVLARFAELEKSPEHIHTYRLSPLSLWNAAASGLTATDILDLLTRYSKYDVPGNIQADVRDYVSRFGRLKLVRGPAGELLLTTDDPILMLEVSRQRKVSQFIVEQIAGDLLPLVVQRRCRMWLASAAIPVTGVALIAFHPVQVGMHQGTGSGGVNEMV